MSSIALFSHALLHCFLFSRLRVQPTHTQIFSLAWCISHIIGKLLIIETPKHTNTEDISLSPITAWGVRQSFFMKSCRDPYSFYMLNPLFLKILPTSPSSELTNHTIACQTEKEKVECHMRFCSHPICQRWGNVPSWAAMCPLKLRGSLTEGRRIGGGNGHEGGQLAVFTTASSALGLENPRFTQSEHKRL